MMRALLLLVLATMSVSSRAMADLACERKVSSSVCLGTLTEDYSIDSKDCDTTSAKQFASEILKIYRLYPDALQKMLCSLDLIAIVNNHPSLGNTFSTADSPSGLGIALSTRLFKEASDAGLTFSVLEEFLLHDPKPKSKWDLIADVSNFVQHHDVLLAAETNINQALFLTLTHELGHYFDEALQLNVPIVCFASPQPESCRDYDSYPWSKLSWSTPIKPSSRSNYPSDLMLCYDQSCHPARDVTPTRARHVYTQLSKSNFISHYAASTFKEDFAETFTYWVVKRYLPGSKVRITIQNEVVYDYLRRLDDRNMKTKTDIISNNFEGAAHDFRTLLLEIGHR